MIFTPTSLPDVILIKPQLFADERGFFMETYHAARFAEHGIPEKFVQDNHSGSRHGIVRGLHYQIRQQQGKLVRVISGEIFDVAVDLRRSSSNFGKWVAQNLSAENRFQLWIPPGYAHGFFVVSEWAEVVYKTTDFYAAEWERTLLWNDLQLAIPWPLSDGEIPIVSEKDKNGKTLYEADTYD